MLLRDDLLEQSYAQGIQAAEGLVENQQIRLIDDGGDKLHPLQHALGQILAFLGVHISEAQPAQQPIGASGSLGTGAPLQTAHVGEECTHLHFPV